ncbi:lamin tail domain-containing protein [Flavobacteriales bacterium]|jgi:predicted extracellular nuclease|nr:lamin tail domain-containing protein [Flavobacteriales bacterium]
MRKLFTLALLAASSTALFAQCDALFISEYIEGWSNNKAIEVYNPTGSEIDMSDFRIERYSNGATAAEENQKVVLSGTIQPNDVLVYVLDKQDPDGVDFEAPVWDELAEKADIWLCPVYEENNAMYFNGNDALVLRQISTNAVMDIFGVIGEDPGSAGWDEVTQNHTLVRRPEVTSGDVAATDEFDVLAVWDSLLVNTFDELGQHVCDCVVSVEEEGRDGFKVFPNPTAGNVFITMATPMRALVVRNMAGLEVRRIGANGAVRTELDLTNLAEGTYFVEVQLTDGSVRHRKVVKH